MEFDVTYRVKLHDKEVELLARTRTKSQFSLDLMSMVQDEMNAGRFTGQVIARIVSKPIIHSFPDPSARSARSQ